MDTDPRGTAAWTEHASAFDRVRAIAVTLDRPRSADWIAEEAVVAGNTARNHLSRLVEMNVLRANTSGQATTYEPDPLYRRLRALHDVLDGRDRDDLLEIQATLQERIEAWRETYDVDSPRALREKATHAETATETRERRDAAADWDVVRYRLDLVRDAVEHYAEYTGATPASA